MQPFQSQFFNSAMDIGDISFEAIQNYYHRSKLFPIALRNISVSGT